MTVEDKVDVDVRRVRTETLKPLERRAEMVAGPMLPDAPIMMTFLIWEDMIEIWEIKMMLGNEDVFLGFEV